MKLKTARRFLARNKYKIYKCWAAGTKDNSLMRRARKAMGVVKNEGISS